MTAQELRIGNLVTIDNPKYWPQMNGIPMSIFGIQERPDLFQIGGYSISLSNEEVYSQGLIYIKPITLTADYLKRATIDGNPFTFDFIAWDNSMLKWLSIGDYSDGYYLFQQLGSRFGREIEFVHQFQNLIFALTGFEVEFAK